MLPACWRGEHSCGWPVALTEGGAHVHAQVDLTVNNLLALVNTKLLRDYAAIDERLVQLVFIVKHWAKRRQVNDAYRGTLSSYCYVLMCIAHLQHRQPPILPCLQTLPPTHYRQAAGPASRLMLCLPDSHLAKRHCRMLWMRCIDSRVCA